MVRQATLQDVARLSGVSRQTVSNVVNSPDIVKLATRERVQSAIDTLGYRPNAAARMLRTQRSSTIGIHLDSYADGIAGVVLDRFVHAFVDLAGARGIRVLVYAAASMDDEVARMIDLRDTAAIDGMLLTGTVPQDPRAAWLLEQSVPFVAFGRPWGADDFGDATHPWVDVDGAAGTAAATTHLLESAGERIAFLGWPSGSGQGDERERGWRETLASAGRTGLRLTGENDVAQARSIVHDVLQDRSHDVDAIVCTSDSLAVGAHLAAVDAGRSSLPIIGFDNTPVAEALGLPSIEQFPEQVAAGAVELLLGSVGSEVLPPVEREHRHVLVEPRLVLR